MTELKWKNNEPKVAVIIFHKNAYKYDRAWTNKCIESIQQQRSVKFDVFELDYGGEHSQLYPDSSFASNATIKNHAEAHNWLLDKVFSLGYEYAFNVNIDDHYTVDRFEKQLVWMKEGYDVVSSNFYHIDGKNRVLRTVAVDALDPEQEAKRDHNIIAHPVCCYSKNFWTKCTKLRPSQIPRDDFELWKRSYRKFKFKILPNFLLYYRVHEKKVSAEGVWKKQ